MTDGKPRDTRPRLAVVVQRYGAEITGGSESLARAVAERLAQDHRVTVYTSCATDYVTWRNELKEGIDHLDGVEIVRFRVEEERDLDSFNAFSNTLYDKPHSEEEELIWLKRQGPYVPRLAQQLEVTKDRYQAILFFTYLYFPTYWGLSVAPEHSILVPTAHDEPPIRFHIYEKVFKSPRALAFCSAAEERFVRRRFELPDRPSAVTGIGIDPPLTPDVEAFKIKYDIAAPYLLYAGRIDTGKGCGEMLEHYVQYRRAFRGAAELVLIGKMAMDEPRIPGVRYLGYLSDEEKAAAMAGARAIICPSPYESLSIVLLEAMALGTPAIVTERSEVLTDHCRTSNAGLWYASGDDFVECVDLLVRENSLRHAMGQNGRRYVDTQYRWETVMDRYRSLIEAVGRMPRRDLHGARR
jgi:glycosyltransferase involved in cell wall biosynthesis